MTLKGYLPFEPAAAHLLFQLVSRRYEHGSVLITSNRAVGDWGTVLGDQVVATAILGSPAAPQPRADHPRRQLPAAREAPLGAAQGNTRTGISRGNIEAEVAGFSVSPLDGFLMSLDT